MLKKIKRNCQDFLEPPFEEMLVGHFQGWETDPDGD